MSFFLSVLYSYIYLAACYLHLGMSNHRPGKNWEGIAVRERSRKGRPKQKDPQAKEVQEEGRGKAKREVGRSCGPSEKQGKRYLFSLGYPVSKSVAWKQRPKVRKAKGLSIHDFPQDKLGLNGLPLNRK